MNGSPMPRKQIERLIAKSAKQVIAQSDIHGSTRSGSKELDHLTRRCAEQPFASPTTAIQFGEELGRRIVALSQKLGRSNLDQGVIRQLVLLKQVPQLAEFQDIDQSGPVAAEVNIAKPAAEASNDVAAEVSIAKPAVEASNDSDDHPVEPSLVDDKIAALTAVSESTEVEDEETDAESVAAIVDSDDTDDDETEETAPAPASAHLSEIAAESEDADSEDDQSETSTAATESETTAQPTNSEAIAEPVA